MTDEVRPGVRRATYSTVKDLDPNERGYHMVLRVQSVAMMVERRRPDGTVVKIAEALVGDETGCIVLTARNEQIPVVQQSQVIVVRNAKIDMYKNFMRLAVDKWGKISAHPDGIASTPAAPASCAAEPNLSTVEYECVNEGFEEGEDADDYREEYERGGGEEEEEEGDEEEDVYAASFAFAGQ